MFAFASMVPRFSVGRQIIRDVIKPKFDLVSVFISHGDQTSSNFVPPFSCLGSFHDHDANGEMP
jgi:hypothetical protein